MTATSPSAASDWENRLGRHHNLITGLLLMLAAWAMYLPSLRYDFVYYDDVRILRDHPELYGQAKLSEDLHAIFVTSFPREEPLLLRDVSWALDSRIFGFGNAFGYHLGNVLLHGIVVALMFVFLLGTTRRYGFALAVSIAYLALAIHTEPVAWIMGHKDILSTMFMLLALCAQTRRMTTESVRAGCGWYVATLACFVFGLLSKISVLSFPLVLLLHACFLTYLNGERPVNGAFLPRSILVKEILLAAPAFAGSLLVYKWYDNIIMQAGGPINVYSPHGATHLWNLLMLDPPTIWVYLQQTFFPWHLNLLYAWPKMLPAYPLWQIAASLASVAAVGVAGVWLFFQRKDIFFYYAAFFAIMVPYLDLLMPGILVAERYLYFSVFCILALAMSLVAAVLRRASKASRVIILTVGVVFLTVNLFQKLSYQAAWRNGETLWQYHLTLPQPAMGAYENLAAYYYANFTSAFAQKNSPLMVSSIRKTAAVVEVGLAEFWSDRRQPPPPEIYYLLFLQSLVQEVNGEPEAALTSLLTADGLRPGFDAINLNLARLYRKMAGTTQDSRQQETYLHAARDRFAEYIALEFPGRPAPPEFRKEMADIEAQYSAMTKASSDGETKPAKKKPLPQ
jgi:hypothetical protein